MAYREIIELSHDDVVEIDIVVEGVSVYYILQPVKEAFKDAVNFIESHKKSLHHTSNFEIHLMINQ